MYEPYDYADSIDDGGHRGKPRGYPHREDLISNATPRGVKKPSGWVFISRKADIGIFLVLLLTGGLGVMWFVSQLPVFVEIASNHYYWAMDLYTTWGTPSMRWLFINVVVGVIVATSGLLSAFGGDNSVQHTDRTVAYDKGVSYRGGDPGVIYGSSDRRLHASEARFTGPGYESPLYNPYHDESVKSGRLHHESSFNDWNHDDEDRHREDDERGEEFGGDRHRGRHPARDEHRDEGYRGMHAARDESFARPVGSTEVMRAARPVSRQGSQRRGVPVPDDAPPTLSREIPREIPREMFDTPRDMPREVRMSREIPREMFDTPRDMPREVRMSREIPGESLSEMSRDMPREVSMAREVPREMSPRESLREIPSDMPPLEEPPPAPPREPSVSREIPVPEEAPVAEEAPPPPQPVSNPEAVEGKGGVGSSFRKEDAIEIISKVYDDFPSPVFEDAESDHGKFHRLKTDSAIHFTPPVNESSADSSPAKPEVLPKSHTFTLGRVIRRDQLVDFIEPLSRKLEGIGRKVRDPHKSSHSENVNQSRDLPAGPPAFRAAPSEVAVKSEPHRQKLSSESVSAKGHTRRLSAESVLPPEGIIPQIPPKIPKLVSGPVAIKHPFQEVVKKPSPPPSPILRQRSIVYPPALLSQASTADEDLSPPGSPPIEEAIPPPPPPYLKLPSSKNSDSASITSSEELPSFKFYVPTSGSTDPSPAAKSSKKKVEQSSSVEDKKFPPGKHSRKPSSIPSTSSQSIKTPDTGSSSGLDERSMVVNSGKSDAGDEQVAEAKEESALDKQEGSSVKDDDLHQQIEDFLARFHENWRLQRQESLARYKKRLVELDE